MPTKRIRRQSVERLTEQRNEVDLAFAVLRAADRAIGLSVGFVRAASLLRCITCARGPASGTRLVVAKGGDRAPSVLVHIAKLAGQTAGQPSGNRRTDLGHMTRAVSKCAASSTPIHILKGVTVSDAEMAALHVEYAEVHGEWNYAIRPSNRSDRAIHS